MDRRDFLTARRRKSKTEQIISPEQTFRTNSGINTYTGAWTEQEIVHVLKRTMFGATKADINYLKSRTMGQAVDKLLNPTAPNPTPPLKD